MTTYACGRIARTYPSPSWIARTKAELALAHLFLWVPENDGEKVRPEGSAKTRRGDTKPTLLDAFLRSHRISTQAVADGTKYHRNHISRLRRGISEPTRECMTAILQWARQATGESVEIGDLFSFNPNHVAEVVTQ